MSTDDRTVRAKRFLQRILPRAAFESLGSPQAAVESLMPSRSLPGEHQIAAENAAKKVATGSELTPPERFALEAIIIPDKRPAIDIVNGDFQVAHPLWTHFATGPIKTTIRRAIPSIGRIELPGHPTLPYGGTGFVVGPRLLMTNRHVAEIFCAGLGLRHLVFRPGYEAAIDFGREKDNPEPSSLDVRDVLMIHPYWDMALLRVEGLPSEHAPLILSLTHPEDLVGRDVAVIGYPAFDPRNDADVQNSVFGGVYNVKRLQPGKLNQRASIGSFGKSVSAATHDSSTLGGNSGSAVLDVATGRIVGLHFAGVYLEANYAVPTSELARDGHVVDAGVNFESGATPEAGIWGNWWRGAEQDEGAALPATAAPLPSVTVSTRPAAPDFSPDRSALGLGDGASWTIPVEITVRVGAPAVRALGARAVAATATEKMVEPIHDEDYGAREGYRQNFLGAAVPLPEATDTEIVARMKNGEHVVPYHHFSLVMHKRRRLALFTASNVDAGKERKQPDPDRKYTRKALGGLGDKDMERWFLDPRLPAAHQLPDRFFTKDKGSFDKGHLVRREDVAWGSSYEEVQLANGDTFHTTNCSPQIAQFNRPGDTDNWGDLEQFVFRQARSERLCVFAGPILVDDDDTFVGVDDAGAVRIKIPSRYWKVVVAADDGVVRSYAFLLEQDLADVPLEFVVDQTWMRHMISLADLEQLLGTVRFPGAVRNADQAGTSHGEAMRAATGLEMIAANELPAVRGRALRH
jgi:endonuclease G